MKSVRKSLAVLALAGGAAVGGFAGTSWVNQARFAYGQDVPQTNPEHLAHLEALSGVYRSVGKALEPTVVQLNVRKKASADGGNHRMPFDDDMLRRFFPDQDGDGEPDVPEGFRGPGGPGGPGGDFGTFGTGSGVIMEIQGNTAYLLTNNHVAGGAEQIEIVLHDGRRLENAKLVGADPKTDLAVVKVEADGLKMAKWGDSDQLQKGDIIMAFGSPFGYIGSMTHGIVSALNRSNIGILGQNGYENFIQVDAPINPGNSGGPLVNVRGEVVGINTAIATSTRSFSGIGFAIPSNQAKFVYASLKEKGKVTRGWLGVSISDVARDPRIARSRGYEGDKGVLVAQTFEKTPAHGKLQHYDVITELNGKPVNSVQELRNTVAATPPGTELKMKVFRGGNFETVSITLGEQPEDPMLAVGRGGPIRPGGEAAPKQPEASAVDAFGMTLATPDDQLAQKFGLDNERRKGALVTEVKPNSSAAKEGLRPGDVITEVDGQKVTNSKEAVDLIGKAGDKGVLLYVQGADGSRPVFVEPKKK